MKYGIVVDSGCDLKELHLDSFKEIDFTRVALKLDIGDKEFVDEPNLNIEEFMKEMYSYKGKTGSAAPSPNDWIEAFEKSEIVFAITITGSLSGSYASVKTAVDLFKELHPNHKIHLIDSKSTGPEMTLLVKKLKELMSEELSFEEIVTKIDSYSSNTNLLFILKSLDNLVKNGRVGKLTASMAGILGIKLLGAASNEGTLELLHKCRGKLAAYDKAVREMTERNYQGGPVVISHCFAPDIANYVAEAIRTSYPMAQITIMPTSGLCSYYAEEGGILIGFESC